MFVECADNEVFFSIARRHVISKLVMEVLILVTSEM